FSRDWSSDVCSSDLTATVAALLDAGKISADTRFTIPSGYTIPGVGFTIRDSVLHGGGLRYTTAGVLVESSNIGIAQMTELMSLEIGRASCRERWETS